MINYSANGIPIENKSTNGRIPFTTGSATPVIKSSTIPAIKGSLSSVINDTTTPVTKAGTIPVDSTSTTPVIITSSTPATTTSTLPVTKASAAPISITSPIPATTTITAPVAKIPTIPEIKGPVSPVMNDTSTPATKAGTIPVNSASTTPVSIRSSTPAITTSTLSVTKASTAPVTKSSTIPLIKTSATPVTKDGSTVVGDPRPTTETSQSNCCSCFAADGIDVLLDSKGSQINFVRVTASLCLLFGLTEIAVGSAVYDYVSDSRSGAWWSALVVLIAGMLAWISTTRRRFIPTLVVAIVGVILSVIGAGLDGVKGTEARPLTACASRSSAAADVAYFGNSMDYTNVKTCIANLGQNPIYGTCLCTNHAGTFCGTYTLTDSSLKSSQTCGDFLKYYPNGVTASAALCGLSAIIVLVLCILSCCIVCCPGRQLMQSKKANSDPPIELSEVDTVPSKGDFV